MSSMFIYISLIASCCSLALFIYLLFMPSLKADTTQPDSLEVHWIWRWLWPWVNMLSHITRPFVSWRYRMSVEQMITKAGRLDYLDAEQLLAMQSTAAVLGGVLGLIVSLYLGLGFNTSLLFVLAGLALGFSLPHSRLKQQAKLRQRLLLKQFPFFLDMITLAVEGGLSLQGALQQTQGLLPKGPLKEEVRHALSDIRAGRSRQEALRLMAERIDLSEVNQLISSIAQSQNLGVSLGPILRLQSEQRRNERFMRAEKLALEAPVKMLFPLVSCIFPCTFIVIAFPIGLKLLGAAW